MKIWTSSMSRLLIAGGMLAAATSLPAAGVRAAEGLSPTDLWGMVRLGEPRLSPDGQRLVLTARSYDVANNSSQSHLWVVPAAGGSPRPITRASVHDGSPRWLAGGDGLLFLSDRSGSSQIWVVDPDGGEPYALSALPLDVGNLTVVPGGKAVAFTLDVYPECADLACTKDRLDAEASSPETGRIYTDLLFRHWDTWEDGRRSHIFVADLERGETASGLPVGLSEPIDLMRGMDADSPTHPFGGPEEFDFSPDGAELTFTARLPRGSEAAWTTDVDLFTVPVNGASKPVEITANRHGWDTQPAYAPDGSTLAYLSMKRPGFEADRLRIVLRDRAGKKASERILADDWDRSVGSLTWTADSKALIVTAQETGRVKIFSVDVATGKVTPLVDAHHNTAVQVASDGRLFFLRDHTAAPADLFTAAADGSSPRALTAVNKERVAKLSMNDAEDFWFTGAHGDRVHGWLVRPVGFRQGRRYPVAFMVHGGPQGAWNDQFHYRWNPQIYAAAGYLTLAINFHGSTGYGQAFTDSISGDWGGAPYEDLMKGLDHLLATEPAADRDRMCALGASYGGYMINWIAGHTDRFACLITHDGVFDERASYYGTEELWFPEWEYRGTPWEHPELYDRFSPSRFVQNWKTPMLVIHGAKDFRLPETEGFSVFTALRRRGIPAKLLYFPDENHWVLHPANALLWHRTVLDWMKEWTTD
ncbi:MAG: prolyl oligopeptidase family serine peptidase [Acidobacteriota bacterium]